MSTQDATRSEYQQDCETYYRLLRDVHSGVFTTEKRKAEELDKSRYSDASHPGIRNLNSLIEILHRLCGDGPEVHGIDYGCGSHWFVDHVRRSFGWQAVGYDPDPLAIEIARKRFPDSADYYRCLDPFRDGLPEEDGTQSFIFCNAVIQHFDNAELERTLAEMARVLRPGGYCMLIFKRWTEELAAGTDAISESIRVLDAASGKVMYQDPTMQKELAKLEPSRLAELDADQRDGWRLLRFLHLDDLRETANYFGLECADQHAAKEQEFPPSNVNYRGGKGVPTACLALQKSTSQLADS
ncbi:MAG: class I SAM-dependent methyltransferase [Planctomycetes bacterium]|nr:class I SAM-dependent methyltransferase [Planctomycetota bacterium]